MRVYQFRHFGSFGKVVKQSVGVNKSSVHLITHFALPTKRRYFFFVGAGDGVSTVDVGTAAGAVAD